MSYIVQSIQQKIFHELDTLLVSNEDLSSEERVLQVFADMNKMMFQYLIFSGHNRANAANLAGLQTVPVIIKHPPFEPWIPQPKRTVERIVIGAQLKMIQNQDFLQC